MRKKTTFLLLFTLLYAVSISATDYFINPETGNNGNSGMSEDNAFKSLSKIEQINLQPGDTVFLMNGTYERSNGRILVIRESGNESNWITIRNYPGHSPLLKFNGWTGIDLINGASYIVFKGLKIQGARTQITLEEALNQPGSCQNNFEGGPQGLYNGTGILAVGPNLKWSNSATTGNEIPHHIIVEDCEIFDCTSSGLAFQQADYITIRNNKIYNNAWYTLYGTSGLNFYQLINTDGTTGIHNDISNNLMYGNQIRVPQLPSCQFYDGNALIVDDLNHEQTGNYKDPSNGYPIYSAKTLIKNNIITENGGSGLHFYLSAGCLVYNNTVVNNAFQNNGNNGNGDLRVGGCQNFEVKNNIFKGNETVHAAGGNLNIDYTNNYQEGPDIFPFYQDCVGCIQEGLTFANMDVNNSSPFISDVDAVIRDAGVSISEVVNDYLNNPRPVDSSYDIGAYELGSCFPTVWYVDMDGDGVGSDSETIESCEQPEGFVAEAGDQCDNNPEILEEQIWYADVDGDGVGSNTDILTACEQPDGYVSISGDDCDDDPSETEGTIWYADTDGDGLGTDTDTIIACEQPEGYVSTSGDLCATDPNKTEPGECGCNVEEGTCDPSSENCEAPVYSIDTIYSESGAIVTYQGRAYRNKWYSKGDIPTAGDPWELIEVCDGSGEDCSEIAEWNPQTVYRARGTQITYEGKIYQNKWYTRNDIPGETRVWEFTNICSANNTALKSDIAESSEIGNTMNATIYPTLFTENITIESPTAATIHIFSATGKMIKFRSIEKGLNQLDLSVLGPGVYFAQIKMADSIRTERIIKR